MPDSPSRYHHGDLANAALEAAADVVAERGLDALGLRPLAKSLGVSHAAVSYHFKTRAALLAAIARQGFERLEAALTAADDPAPVARLHAAGRAYVAFARRHPGHFRVMFGRELLADGALPADLNDASEAAFAAFAGLFASGRLDADMLLAWSTAHGIADLYVHGPLRERAGDADALDAWIDDALRRAAVAALG